MVNTVNASEVCECRHFLLINSIDHEITLYRIPTSVPQDMQVSLKTLWPIVFLEPCLLVWRRLQLQ